jgi:ABC transport system ATP-binding/permease protein
MAELPIIKIHPPGHYVELDADELFLGRDSRLAALVPCLQDPGVSTRHCVIRRDGRRWVLEDLGATNGTWLRGRALKGKAPLRTGDAFMLGQDGPRVECVAGFGEPLPRTAAEAAEAATVLTEPPPPTTPSIDGRTVPSRRPRGVGASDGSAEHPFRVAGEPTLRLVHQKDGKEISGTGRSIVIGRDPSATQILIRSDDERHVSGRHAEVRFLDDGRVVVRDLGSTNGTWLNDIPVRAEAPLAVGDKLVLGNAPTVLVVAALEI